MSDEPRDRPQSPADIVRPPAPGGRAAARAASGLGERRPRRRQDPADAAAPRSVPADDGRRGDGTTVAPLADDAYADEPDPHDRFGDGGGATDPYDDEGWDDDHHYEELKPATGRGRRVLLVVVVVFGLLAVSAGGGWLWLQRQIDPPGGPGDEVSLVIPAGSSTDAIADQLEAEGVVTSAQIFRLYLRFNEGGSFQAGEYQLRLDSAMGDVVATLGAGPTPPELRRYTVPEGLTLDEIAVRLSEEVPDFSVDAIREAIAAAAVRPAALPAEAATTEGFLFPSTYELPDVATETEAVAQMAGQFDIVAERVGLVAGAQAVGLTPYEVVIVASMIQEEAGIGEDMPRIARVVYNRIADGMPLGIDAVNCYAVEERPCVLTTAVLEEPGPYNSRLNQGLPPTPIAAPGEDALRAALAPEEGPWLYYVLDPDESRTPPGGHFFTDSYDDFLDVREDCAAADLGCG